MKSGQVNFHPDDVHFGVSRMDWLVAPKPLRIHCVTF